MEVSLFPSPYWEVQIVQGTLEDVHSDVDCIVSPANSYGIMEGGFDLAISNLFANKNTDIVSFGKHIRSHLFAHHHGHLPVGTTTIIDLNHLPNSLNCRYLALTPTMRVPSRIQDPHRVYECTWSLLNAVSSHDSIKTLILSGLGTGVGGVDPDTCAFQMFTAMRHFMQAASRSVDDHTNLHWMHFFEWEKELQNVGQPVPKRILAVQGFNHILRIRDDYLPPIEPLEPSESAESAELSVTLDSAQTDSVSNMPQPSPLSSTSKKIPISKSNILLWGPTGTGKTLLAETLAKHLDVPFAIADCTTFTQAGYVGDDPERCIQMLLENSGMDIDRTERGIIVLDEFDKIARRPTVNGTRDVSGEGVQQALLKMIEGTTTYVSAKVLRPRTTVPTSPSSTAPHNSYSAEASPAGSDFTAPAKGEKTPINTTNILFIFTGAFTGLDKIISRRLNAGKIGFTRDSRTANAADALSPYDDISEDLITYGFIPELIGRIPVTTKLNHLSKADLVAILTEPENSLVKQYQAKFSMFEVDLRFSEAALYAIGEIAFSQGTGARGLRSIMERVLLNANYEIPGSPFRYVLVTKRAVDSLSLPPEDRVDPLYFVANQYSEMIQRLESDGKSQDAAQPVPEQSSKPTKHKSRKSNNVEQAQASASASA
ncbi:hypothetical protein CANCADRAFT_3044 [Tortispora caseinolytica NRRL Y-17796]|uniref:Macro domain-containing protein n=1 Tax=Tortispora caseinolytica NRRL Y-17796 TaxID=767744 RepID=A0A1E4THV9_9ASCO|nr:hypothetical protein CANCADRAFT_3044 [Tortispora caseinolytica NRRL Y-17796]